MLIGVKMVFVNLVNTERICYFLRIYEWICMI